MSDDTDVNARVLDQERIERVESANAAVFVAERALREAQERLATLQPAYVAAQQAVAAARAAHDGTIAVRDGLIHGAKLHPLLVASVVKRAGFRTAYGRLDQPMDERYYVGVRPLDPWRVAVSLYGSARARRVHDFAAVLAAVRAVIERDGRFTTRYEESVTTEFVVAARKDSDAPTNQAV